jgi:hypothetical protein
MQALDLQIRVHGWVLQQVAGEGEAWCYTIGLLEHYGHPELTLLDVDTAYQRDYIDEVVNGVVALGSLPTGLMRVRGLECVEVHQDHLVGELFGTWANRYGRFPRPGEMLQVLPPPGAFCECHTASIRRLDQPGTVPVARRTPNRAERRRRK